MNSTILPVIYIFLVRFTVFLLDGSASCLSYLGDFAFDHRFGFSISGGSLASWGQFIAWRCVNNAHSFILVQRLLKHHLRCSLFSCMCTNQNAVTFHFVYIVRANKRKKNLLANRNRSASEFMQPAQTAQIKSLPIFPLFHYWNGYYLHMNIYVRWIWIVAITQQCRPFAVFRRECVSVFKLILTEKAKRKKAHFIIAHVIVWRMHEWYVFDSSRIVRYSIRFF